MQAEFRPDMNAWLKYHGALITPICLAIEYEKGETKRIHHFKALRLSVKAVKEAIAMYEKMGYLKDAPHDMKFFQWPTSIISYLMAWFLPTKTGHLIAIDHAMAAQSEIAELGQEILSFSKTYNQSLPAFKELCLLCNLK